MPVYGLAKIKNLAIKMSPSGMAHGLAIRNPVIKSAMIKLLSAGMMNGLAIKNIAIKLSPTRITSDVELNKKYNL